MWANFFFKKKKKKVFPFFLVGDWRLIVHGEERRKARPRDLDLKKPKL